MFVRDLFDNTNRTAVVSFARMNPPTTGHMKLAERMMSLGGDPYLFLSHKHNHKTDPLCFNEKSKFVNKFFPGIVVGNPAVTTVIQGLKLLETLNYNNIMFVAGSDRINEFSSFIDKYNGKEYNFDKIDFVSAGTRDNSSHTVAGMSASKLREYARKDDFKSFKQGVPKQEFAKALFESVQESLQNNSRQNVARGNQEVTPELLKKLEFYIDHFFKKIGIDVTFTQHFIDRVNDNRNIKQITVLELAQLFKNTYSRYGKRIAKMNPSAQAVIKDMQSDINLPFVLQWDSVNNELDLIAKTVMRKKNFTTPDQELIV